MHDCVDLLGSQHPRHQILVADTSTHQRTPANRPLVPCAKVIDNDWDVTRARKRLARMASDISGTAGN
jgi:hypothetical protein